MIHVFLDTTVFRQDPKRKKAMFRVVERLSELKKLKVYISEITRREFLTDQELLSKKELDKLESSSNTLLRRFPDIKVFAGLHDKMDAARGQVKAIIEGLFDNWVKQFDVCVLPIDNSHGQIVLEKYFTGKPPFTDVKARKDFPDGFIWEAVISVADRVRDLHFVSGDEFFRDTISKASNYINSHETLHNFGELTTLQQLLERTENIDKLFNFLEEHIKHRVKLLPMLKEAIENPLILPFTEESEATIQGVSNLEKLSLNVTLVEDYGDGLFVLPFSAKFECIVQYFMYKADYWASETKSNFRTVEDWNDYVYQLEDICNCEVAGTLRIEINPHELESCIRKMKESDWILSEAETAVEDIPSITITLKKDEYNL